MNPAFWHQRWEEGRIGFHLPEVHRHLPRFWPQLEPQREQRVLVPLCGKSLDMLWLAEQGHRVVGVEISPLAAAAFFEENRLPLQRQVVGDFTRYQCDEIELLCGDFFQLDAALLGPFQRVYDRASLIALPPPMRRDYAAQLISLLPEGGRVLLVTLEYPPDELEGPPFSVAPEEVAELYQPMLQIRELEGSDILPEEPRFQQQGVTRLWERVYTLTRPLAGCCGDPLPRACGDEPALRAIDGTVQECSPRLRG